MTETYQPETYQPETPEQVAEQTEQAAPTVGAHYMPGPNDPPISVEDMLSLGKLLPLGQLRERLATTEPLAYRTFEPGAGVRFRVPQGWDAREYSLWSGDVTTHAVIDLAGTEYPLTKDALVEVCKPLPGISESYVQHAPAHLLETTLNHWYVDAAAALPKDMKLMIIGDADPVGHAVVRGSVVPFLNGELVDRAITAITERYGDNVRVLADATKLHHSLRRTHLQLVLPDIGRTMAGTGEVDDRWWAGVQLTNSLAGELQTVVEGFVFRQRCTNGMIEVGPTASAWSRRGREGNSAEGAYEWARYAVDDVLGGLEGAFDKVQGLVEHSLVGEVAASARDMFDTYRIPQAARNRIMAQLVETDQLNLYALTNAITAAANESGNTREQQQLMRAGGSVTEHPDRCDSCHRLRV